MNVIEKIKKRILPQVVTVWDYPEERWVILPSGMPTDDETALRLIPQDEAYQEAYQLRRDMGWTPLEAFGEIHRYITDWHNDEESKDEENKSI